MIHFDHPINNIWAWEKFHTHRLQHDHSYLFPLKNLKSVFRVRHGGDPLTAVVNLSKYGNHLTFDESSKEKLTLALVLLSVAGLIFLYTAYRCF